MAPVFSFIFVLFSVLLGASMGSFLNVVASRTVEGRPWWGGERSRCDRCGKVLSAAELVPLLSWFAFSGRCRSCGVKIPARYLLVEVFGAALGGLIAWKWGPSATAAFAALVAAGLFLNALTDLYSGFVYDLLAWGLGIAGLALRVFGGWGALAEGLLGAGLGFAVIAVIIIASRGGMGWGDASLAAGMGAALGWRLAAWGLYTGFMMGGLTALALLLSRRVRRKDPIPLGPFLAAGGILAMLTGSWFFSYLGMSPGWPWG